MSAVHGFATNYATIVTNSTQVQDTKKLEKKIPKPSYPPSHPFLKRVIRSLNQEKAPLVSEIKKLAEVTLVNPHNQTARGIAISSEQKICKVLEAIKSIDYSPLKRDLKIIIKKMSNEERKGLLSRALRSDFSTNQKFLGNQCINLMTLEHLRLLAKFVSPEFTDVQATAETFNHISQVIKKYAVEEAHLNLPKNSKGFFLFKFIGNFIRTIAVAFNLIELGKEPSSYFETKYMLDIYWRLLEIPIKIIKFVLSFIINPLISFVVLVVGAIASAIALHIFKKWFDKCPEQLNPCKNLTAEIRKGTIKPIFGREKELDKVLEVLAANSEKNRKHPLIIGKPGIGKTEMMNGLAWRLVKGDVPPALKGKKLFILNCAELMKNPNAFALKDPLEQIMDKIGKHQKDLIIIFDEADKLSDTLGTRFNSILDTSKDSLFYAIGITTRANYKDKIENTCLDRRFQKLPMDEAKKKQTLTILRHIHQQESNDIKIPKEVFKAICKETKKITRRYQPDKAILVMSQAIEKIRHRQNGGAFDNQLHDEKAVKDEWISKLSRKNLHGIAIKSKKIQAITNQIEKADLQINKTLKQITKKRKISAHYIDLKKQREWHKNWLYTTSEKINQDTMKGKKINALLEKVYLFNSFILMPELDAYSSDYVKKNKLEVKIDAKLITEIVDNLVKQEKIEE